MNDSITFSHAKYLKYFHKIFLYPDQNYFIESKKCLDELNRIHPSAGLIFSSFYDKISKVDLSSLEELFIKTFDVQAICYLEVGYVLFGEDYKRGKLLVKLQQEHTKTSNNCGIELPDHLSNIVNLLPEITDTETVTTLVTHLIIPSIKKMLESFKDSQNIYQYALNALLISLQEETKNIHYSEPVYNTNTNYFLQTQNSEIL